MSTDPDSTMLSESYIQDCFHSYLRSSLTQAKAERLLGVDVLASAEADLMITGPALCLFFAAIRSTTNPPSVPLPRLDKNQPPMELSPSNCPPAYATFLRVWSNTVQPIQSLAPEAQHDLARLICNLEPVSRSPPHQLPRLAADLRAVAIEISQRRTFQERYQDDLQAAIDAGSSGGGAGPSRGQGSARAAFVPPPSYDTASTPGSSTRPSPSSPALELSPTEPLRIHRRTPSAASAGGAPAPAPGFPVPSVPDFDAPGLHKRTPSALSATNDAAYPAGPQSPGLLSPSSASKPLPPSPSSASPALPPRSRSPSFLPSHAPAIELIRETLYASLGDTLGRSPSLRRLLKEDPPRAYFGAVALAVLDVATHAVTRDGSVVGVLGQELTLARCPEPLRPLMLELGELGRKAREMEEEDSTAAVEALTAGEEPPEPRLDRVKLILEEGVGVRDAAEREEENRRSVEGRALAFANRVNGLALAMTRLRPFRERQDEVFKVLAGVDS